MAIALVNQQLFDRLSLNNLTNIKIMALQPRDVVVLMLVMKNYPFEIDLNLTKACRKVV